MDIKKSYDYIVIGSGPGGAPIASRLSENPDISVLILEAGTENINSVSRIQGAFSRAWKTDYDWQYQTTEQEGLNGRNIYQPRGKVLGGSSGINVGVWVRGAAYDFDNWERLGADGWNFQTAKRLFTQIEDSDRGPSEYRGKGGPMYMADMPSASPIADNMLEGFVEAGFGSEEDTNGKNPFSVNRMQSIYKNRQRRTVADAYLSHEIRKRKNLDIITSAYVNKILFDGTQASGVEYEYNGESRQVNSSKEIILSAGAYNTPKILKLSGIGPKDELEKFGIPLITDLPGVGENLQDQLSVGLKALAPEGVDGSVPMDPSDEAIQEWVWTKRGPASYFSGVNVGFISHDGNNEGWPEFELLLDYNPGAADNDEGFKGIKNMDKRSGYAIDIIQLHPQSRGSVKLNSPDPKDDPAVDPGYFKDERDMDLFVQAIRRVGKMTKTEALKEYTEEVSPKLDASDNELEEYIRNTASTVFHPVGTAKMGSKDDDAAVVDNHLRVKGVDGLRVCDASVMPTITSGHTMSPTIMISERLAEIMTK